MALWRAPIHSLINDHLGTGKQCQALERRLTNAIGQFFCVGMQKRPSGVDTRIVTRTAERPKAKNPLVESSMPRRDLYQDIRTVQLSTDGKRAIEQLSQEIERSERWRRCKTHCLAKTTALIPKSSNLVRVQVLRDQAARPVHPESQCGQGRTIQPILCDEHRCVAGNDVLSAAIDCVSLGNVTIQEKRVGGNDIRYRFSDTHIDQCESEPRSRDSHNGFDCRQVLNLTMAASVACD